MVRTFSAWVESLPIIAETLNTIYSCIINNILSRIGLPGSIQSDNGLSFIPKVANLVLRILGVQWHLHIPYHLKALGKVERANESIKIPLSKLFSELHFPLLQPLPVLLI